MGAQPVYEEMEAELTKMVGRTTYRALAAYLRDHAARGVPLPHPAVRR